MNFSKTDIYWMQQALKEAEKAENLGEVPVGAVLVLNDEVIATGHNQPISDNDPSAHAEMITLRRAGKALENYRLLNTTLYVTLEPCIMCTGLLIHSRIKRLVYGANDPKAGAIGSICNLLEHPSLNHKVEVTSGVLAENCGLILKQFFAKRRHAGG